jgi:hypothetical protein
MGNDHQVTDPRDEIILEARYSGAAFWLSQIALLVFGCLVLYASYDYLLRGVYRPVENRGGWRSKSAAPVS